MHQNVLWIYFGIQHLIDVEREGLKFYLKSSLIPVQAAFIALFVKTPEVP